MQGAAFAPIVAAVWLLATTAVPVPAAPGRAVKDPDAPASAQAPVSTSRRTTTLEIAAPAGEPVYLRRTLKPGDTVTYRYVHSASGTPVEERWVVVAAEGAPGLRVRSITQEATGADLPTGVEVPEATSEAMASGSAVRGLDQPVGLPLDLRVAPAARNTLEIAGETIDLTRFPAARGGGSASLVRLTLR